VIEPRRRRVYCCGWPDLTGPHAQRMLARPGPTQPVHQAPSYHPMSELAEGPQGPQHGLQAGARPRSPRMHTRQLQHDYGLTRRSS